MLIRNMATCSVLCERQAAGRSDYVLRKLWLVGMLVFFSQKSRLASLVKIPQYLGSCVIVLLLLTN